MTQVGDITVRRLARPLQWVQDRLRGAALVPGLEQLDPTVTEGKDAARTLYARSGFVEWGRLQRAVRIGQQYLAKVHMARPLR